MTLNILVVENIRRMRSEKAVLNNHFPNQVSYVDDFNVVYALADAGVNIAVINPSLRKIFQPSLSNLGSTAKGFKLMEYVKNKGSKVIYLNSLPFGYIGSNHKKCYDLEHPIPYDSALLVDQIKELAEELK